MQAALARCLLLEPRMDAQHPTAPNRIAASSDAPAVTFSKVSHSFDSLWGGKQARALISASFEIRRGEIFGLVGPARCGKSTALKMMAGQLRPMEGSVKVFARSPSRARAALVPQNAPAAALAQTLLKKPGLLLLDEPFASLDVTGAAQLKDIIRSLARQGVTVVVASARLIELKDLCERVAVFSNGVIEAVGTIAGLLDSPAALPWLAPTLPVAITSTLLEVTRSRLDLGESRSALATSSINPASDAPQFGRAALRGDTLRAGNSEDLPEKSRPRATDAARDITRDILERLVKPAGD